MFCSPTMVSVHAPVVNVWQCITQESMNTPFVGDWIAGIAAARNSYMMIYSKQLAI